MSTVTHSFDLIGFVYSRGVIVVHLLHPAIQKVSAENGIAPSADLLLIGILIFPSSHRNRPPKLKLPTPNLAVTLLTGNQHVSYHTTRRVSWLWLATYWLSPSSYASWQWAFLSITLWIPEPALFLMPFNIPLRSPLNQPNSIPWTHTFHCKSHSSRTFQFSYVIPSYEMTFSKILSCFCTGRCQCILLWCGVMHTSLVQCNSNCILHTGFTSICYYFMYTIIQLQ